MPEFLDLDAALSIHHAQVEAFGGLHGLRNQDLLESALGAVEQTYAYTNDLYQTAAQHLVPMARNHPFVDGNKRTATACMLVFMDLNGLAMNMEAATLFELVLAAATGEIDREAIAKRLQA